MNIYRGVYVPHSLLRRVQSNSQVLSPKLHAYGIFVLFTIHVYNKLGIECNLIESGMWECGF